MLHSCLLGIFSQKKRNRKAKQYVLQYSIGLQVSSPIHGQSKAQAKIHYTIVKYGHF